MGKTVVVVVPIVVRSMESVSSMDSRSVTMTTAIERRMKKYMEVDSLFASELLPWPEDVVVVVDDDVSTSIE